MAAGGKGSGGGEPSKSRKSDRDDASGVDPAAVDAGPDSAQPNDEQAETTRKPAWPAGAEVPESDQPPEAGPALAADTAEQARVADDKAADTDTMTAARGTDTPAATEEPAPASDEAPEAPAEGASETDAPRADAALPSDTEPASEPPAKPGPAAAPVPPVAPPPPARRRGGLLGVLVGGAVAAGGGFLAAQYADPQGWPFAQPGQTAIDRALGAQADQLRTLETALADLRTEVSALALTQAEDDVAGLAAGVAALEARLGALDGTLAALDDRTAAAEAVGSEAGDRLTALGSRLDGIDARLTTIERAPIEGSDIAAAALESYTRELAELREQIEAALAATDAIGPLGEDLAALQAQVAEFPAVDDMRAEVAAIAARLDEVIATNEALRAEAAAQVEAAAAAERAARARSALIRVEAALDGGGGYADALADLEAAGLTIPAELAASAATGVQTRAQLVAGFGPAARATLAVAHREVEGLGMADRVAAFFRAQFGIRSLAPREGDDPDAILSRAEAALAGNDLATALAELEALPPGPAAEMAAWIAGAEARKAAVAAAAAVAAELDSL